MWGGDVQHPGIGRQQLCFPPTAGEPQSPALAPDFSLSRHQEGGALPSSGLLSSAAELLPSGSHSGCGMLCLTQNSSLWCNPGGGVIASPEGKLPSSSSGTAKALLASQSEHLSASLQLQKQFKLKIALGLKV